MLSPGALPRLSGTGFQYPFSFRYRSAKQDQTEALRSVLFDQTVLKGSVALGAEESRCWRGAGESPCQGAERAPKEHVVGSKERVLGKEEETERRRAVPERGKWTVPKRRRGLGERCWRGEETGAASEGGEETGAGGVERKGEG